MRACVSESDAPLQLLVYKNTSAILSTKQASDARLRLLLVLLEPVKASMVGAKLAGKPSLHDDDWIDLQILGDATVKSLIVMTERNIGGIKHCT